jgi:hypothetical protein
VGERQCSPWSDIPDHITQRSRSALTFHREAPSPAIRCDQHSRRFSGNKRIAWLLRFCTADLFVCCQQALWSDRRRRADRGLGCEFRRTHSSEPPAERSRSCRSYDLDVHAETIAVAIADPEETAMLRNDRRSMDACKVTCTTRRLGFNRVSTRQSFLLRAENGLTPLPFCTTFVQPIWHSVRCVSSMRSGNQQLACHQYLARVRFPPPPPNHFFNGLHKIARIPFSPATPLPKRRLELLFLRAVPCHVSNRY